MNITKHIALGCIILAITSCENKPKIHANKTSIFKVWGNCEMCKETIESSLKVDGIAKVDWNTETKRIDVNFDSTKINLDQIKKNIASVGYDNDTYKGDETAYTNLHECCKYERK